MTTKKSTKYSSPSRTAELFFGLVCLLVAALAFADFWIHLNQTLSRKGGQQIATITFKYHTAQRHFIDRVLWDRLRQNSPVYNGDTVRIAPKSEATVHFSDGSAVNLGENTLAQFSVKQDKSAAVRMDEGNLDVQSGTKGLSVESGGRKIQINASASVGISAGDGLSISVEKGSASLGLDSGSRNVEAGSALSVSGSGEIGKPEFAVISPAHNSRILDFSTDPVPVSFACSYTGGGSAAGLLELSDTQDFKTSEKTEFADLGSVSASVSPGVWYWRLSAVPANGTAPNAALSASGRFSVLYAPRPAPIAPIRDYVAQYRTRKPALRFIWTENDYASSYQLEVADNQAMNSPRLVQRTSFASSIVSSLGEGTWYWRVRPFYSINSTGLSEPSDTSVFRIVKSGELLAPQMLLPAPDAIVDSASKKNDGRSALAFSWSNSSEAASYTFRISKNSSMSSPLIDEKTENNYYFYGDAGRKLDDGEWYWQVSINDVEGNSASSEIRRFYAAKGAIEQRTLFPPEGYRLSQTLAPDTKYVWKSNVPAETRFQISRDSGFEKCVVDEIVTTTSFAGRDLKPGTYYWRIYSKLGSKELKTEPRPLIIEPPLDPPDCIAPANAGRAVIRPATPFRFAWNKVDGADYYNLKFYSDSQNGSLLFEQNFIDSTSYLVDLEHMPEKRYRWTLQAFRQETPMASRATGYIGSYTFDLRKLRPVELSFPANGTLIGGEDAIKRPASLRWSSVDRPVESRLILYRGQVSKENIILNIENPKTELKMPRLYEGRYFWTVSARTGDDLDISAVEPNTFTVGAIPRLPAVQNPRPLNGTVVNKDYLAKSRAIVFSWDAVRGATQYEFRLVRIGQQKAVLERTVAADSRRLELKDLTVLAQGQYEWTVEAQSTYEGSLFQSGIVTASRFSIDLPKVSAPQLSAPGDLYGR